TSCKRGAGTDFRPGAKNAENPPPPMEEGHHSRARAPRAGPERKRSFHDGVPRRTLGTRRTQEPSLGDGGGSCALLSHLSMLGGGGRGRLQLEAAPGHTLES